jgi:hypothetical protein
MFDALGTMAERLARTASTRADGAAATHLEVAESYGVHFVSYEASERTRLCYDGEAFRHVLALGGAPTERARAALALTAPECTPPLVGATELGRIEEGRLAILLEVAEAPPAWWSRINVRRAQLGADLAWAFARRGDAKSAQAAADGAVRSLARVDRSELGEEDQAAYRDAALRVAASGWGAEDAAPRKGLGLRAGEPGETCVRWGEAEKCTYGQVWSASFRLGPSGRAALAVEPMPGWLELWLFSGDRVDVLAPSTDSADFGYVELAGFAGDGSRAVVVRESTRGRSFQVVKLDGLLVEHQASTFTGLGGARRWASADWKARTLALR